MRSTLKKVLVILVLLTVAMFFTSCGEPSAGGGDEPTVEKSSEKAITSFSFTSPEATGVVDETAHTINITVPYGTAVTALVPTIVVSDKASVSPESGVSVDALNIYK